MALVELPFGHRDALLRDIEDEEASDSVERRVLLDFYTKSVEKKKQGKQTWLVECPPLCHLTASFLVCEWTMGVPFLISGKRVVALRRAMALAEGLLDMVECNEMGGR